MAHRQTHNLHPFCSNREKPYLICSSGITKLHTNTLNNFNCKSITRPSVLVCPLSACMQFSHYCCTSQTMRRFAQTPGQLTPIVQQCSGFPLTSSCYAIRYVILTDRCYSLRWLFITPKWRSAPCVIQPLCQYVQRKAFC